MGCRRSKLVGITLPLTDLNMGPDARPMPEGKRSESKASTSVGLGFSFALHPLDSNWRDQISRVDLEHKSEEKRATSRKEKWRIRRTPEELADIVDELLTMRDRGVYLYGEEYTDTIKLLYHYIHFDFVNRDYCYELMEPVFYDDNLTATKRDKAVRKLKGYFLTGTISNPSVPNISDENFQVFLAGAYLELFDQLDSELPPEEFDSMIIGLIKYMQSCDDELGSNHTKVLVKLAYTSLSRNEQKALENVVRKQLVSLFEHAKSLVLQQKAKQTQVHMESVVTRPEHKVKHPPMYSSKVPPPHLDQRSNINTVGFDTISLCKGVGLKSAGRIIDHIHRQGIPVTDIAHMKVPYVGPAKKEKLVQYFTA